jgi:predicted RNase H-like HicB family nuclease
MTIRFTSDMSRDLRNGSKRKRRAKALTEAFDGSVLLNAQEIVRAYRIILERDKTLGFIGSSVELPTVFADAKTPEKCYQATQEALTVAVATMIECGQRPPQPSSAKKRNEQVNVRLTSEEKILLSNAASSLGFKGISDFLRNTALNRILSNH